MTKYDLSAAYCDSAEASGFSAPSASIFNPPMAGVEVPDRESRVGRFVALAQARREELLVESAQPRHSRPSEVAGRETARPRRPATAFPSTYIACEPSASTVTATWVQRSGGQLGVQSQSAPLDQEPQRVAGMGVEHVAVLHAGLALVDESAHRSAAACPGRIQIASVSPPVRCSRGSLATSRKPSPLSRIALPCGPVDHLGLAHDLGRQLLDRRIGTRRWSFSTVEHPTADQGRVLVQVRPACPGPAGRSRRQLSARL